MYQLREPIAPNTQSTRPVEAFLIDSDGNEIGAIWHYPGRPVASEAIAIHVIACINSCTLCPPEELPDLLKAACRLCDALDPDAIAHDSNLLDLRNEFRTAFRAAMKQNGEPTESEELKRCRKHVNPPLPPPTAMSAAIQSIADSINNLSIAIKEGKTV